MLKGLPQGEVGDERVRRRREPITNRVGTTTLVPFGDPLRQPREFFLGCPTLHPRRGTVR